MMGNGVMISRRAGGFMSGSTKTDTKGLVAGLAQGKGRMEWNDGTRYEGDF